MVRCEWRDFIEERSVLVSYSNELLIESPSEMVGTVGNAVARYNSEIVQPVWSLAYGSENATINASG